VGAAVKTAAPFDLGQATPDPVGLLGGKGVVEAVVADRAGIANPLGALLSGTALGRGLGVVEAEEKDRRILQAGSFLSPFGLVEGCELFHDVWMLPVNAETVNIYVGIRIPPWAET
jgi:hypothetical protein